MYFYIIDSNGYYLCALEKIGYVFSSDIYIIMNYAVKYVKQLKAEQKSREFSGTKVTNSISIPI